MKSNLNWFTRFACALPNWFTPWWWRYLLTDCRGWANFWCRVRGHPYPVVWYTVYRLEPDMRCTNCDEDLG